MDRTIEIPGSMLHLKLPTDPRWADAASKNLQEILADHAWCEQKAASSCISLIIQYPHLPELVETLSPIVEEEWTHFNMVLSQLKKRNLDLLPARVDEYVKQLAKFSKRGGTREDQLTDKLLLCALIEARSCERFKTLANQLEDQELKDFYRDLMISEAGHYVTFITLARNYQDRTVVDKRWQDILTMEAEIIANMGTRPDRIH